MIKFPEIHRILNNFSHCYSKKLQTFAVLCEQYQKSISRDPCYVQYLDKIGQLFFGVKPPEEKKKRGGLFGNILESFLGNYFYFLLFVLFIYIIFFLQVVLMTKVMIIHLIIKQHPHPDSSFLKIPILINNSSVAVTD